VARVTIHRGGDVPAVFWICTPPGVAAVVTGCTLIRIHFMRGIMRVAREGCRGESRREAVMTGIAGEYGGDMVSRFSGGSNSVTGIALPGDEGAVVNVFRVPVPSRRVTVITGAGRWMRSARTRGSGSANNMASFTGPRGDAGVIKSCRDPCRGAMALVTGRIGHYVFCRFAGCGDPVVAGNTTAWRHANVIVACTGPGHLRAVTLAARHNRYGVFGGFKGAGDTAALGVAALALARRALEDALQVAGLAIGLGVCPEQREAGLNMVEALAGVLFCRGKRGSENQGCRDQNNGEECPDQNHGAFHITPSYCSSGRHYCFPWGAVSTPGSSLRNERVLWQRWH